MSAPFYSRYMESRCGTPTPNKLFSSIQDHMQKAPIGCWRLISVKARKRRMQNAYVLSKKSSVALSLGRQLSQRHLRSTTLFCCKGYCILLRHIACACYCYTNCCGSIRMPAPIVDEIATLRIYLPLTADGRAATNAPITALRFPLMPSSSKETFPIGT